MSFQDLPADWPTRPVTDPAITADLLDLVVRDSDRRAGAVAILLCGPSGRMVQPVVVALPPGRTTEEERRRPFDVMCQALLNAVDGDDTHDETRAELSADARHQTRDEAGDETGDETEDETRERGGLLVALARPGSVLVTADDRSWERAARASCDAYGVGLLGCWLVTPGAIRPLPAREHRRPA